MASEQPPVDDPAQPPAEERSADAQVVDDDIDEELLALSAPPPSLRFALITALVLVLSVAMLVWFFPDLSYLIQGLGEPQHLGEASDVDVAALEDNSYVSLEGIPWITRTLVFQKSRRWFAMSDNSCKMFPLTGQAKILVQWDIPPEHKVYRDPHVDPTSLALPTYFEGRLVRKGQLGRNYNKVWLFFASELRLEVDDSAWVLIDDERPAHKFWVVPVYLIFLAMIAINILKLRRFWLAWRA